MCMSRLLKAALDSTVGESETLDLLITSPMLPSDTYVYIQDIFK